MDTGMAVTGLSVFGAVVGAFLNKRCLSLPALLVASYGATCLALDANASKEQMVFLAASTDLAIAAIVAVFIIPHARHRTDARIVGFMSVSLSFTHLAMSVTQGGISWFLYVAAVNAVFVLQCLVAGGFVDGLVRTVDRVAHWLGNRAVSLVRTRR